MTRRDGTGIEEIQTQIVGCVRCPRLVEWRERVAIERVRRFADQEYWGRPVPSFGDPAASVVVVGLAPAAHGANRTGRMFTGDRSGEWLYRALHRAGFANRAESEHAHDGLTLRNCWITAAVHCAPPDNKPSREEATECRNYLVSELRALENMRVVVALGRLAWDAVGRALADAGIATVSRNQSFAHGAEIELGRITLVGSYHPSQQNTFTGRLTEPMLDAVFTRVGAIVATDAPSRG